MLAISNVFENINRKLTQIAKNCSRRQPHSHLRPPPRRTRRISACTLYFQKLEFHFCCW